MTSQMKNFPILVLSLLFVFYVSAQDEFCDLCGDNKQPANVDLIVPFLAIGDNDNPTCQQVFEFGSQSVAPTDDVCSLIKSHKDFCGCPGASVTPLNFCSLCPEGATPLNLNAVTPFEDTCSELDTYLKYIPADLCLTERVGSIMRADAFCGCPGVKAECYMCDDDTNNLSYPDRLVPFYEFLGNSFSSSCQELADFYTLYDTDDPEISTCDFVKIESGYCGCQSNTDNSPVDACKLCSDGSSPISADKYVEEIKMTCSELESYLNYVPADQCEMPWIAELMRFDFYCGCAAATAPCPICPDGTIEVANPDAIVPYLIIPNNENPTCRQLATLGVIAEPGELVLDDCSIFEAQSDFCGCSGATKPAESCEFCSDGVVPPNPSLTTPFGDTCEELSEYLSFLPSDQCDNERIGFIKRQDFLCGCPSATTGCALCADHGSNAVEFADRHIPLLSLPLNTNPTCQEVIEFMAVNDGDLSDAGCSALQGYAGYCGCPETTVKNECAFCPKGGTPTNPDKVVSDLFTCQGLHDFVSFLDKDGCSEESNDFKQIQAFDYVCGCPRVTPNCMLCSEGIDLPNASKITGDSDGTTCGEYAEFVASLTADQCISQDSEIIGTASACGCERASLGNIPVAGEAGKCQIQQNVEFCTDQLLDTATEECDCYAFCDSKFVKCQSALGGLLQSNECSGTPVTGCNRFGVTSGTPMQPSVDQITGKESEKIYKNGPNLAVVIPAIVVPLVMAFLIVIYYCYTRKSTLQELKINAGFDGTESSAPPPVQAMEGSLSMSDIPIATPKSTSPPPETFVSDNAALDTIPDNKIV